MKQYQQTSVYIARPGHDPLVVRFRPNGITKPSVDVDILDRGTSDDPNTWRYIPLVMVDEDAVTVTHE